MNDLLILVIEEDGWPVSYDARRFGAKEKKFERRGREEAS